MPSATFAPLGAILHEQDWQAFAGVDLFTAGGFTVKIDASTTRFDDVIAAINGRGSEDRRCLGKDISTGWTGAGTITAGIDENDRLWIENDTEGFDVLASADNAAFGIDVAGQSAVNTGGTVHRLTATVDWLRGVVENKVLRLDPASGAAFDSPAYAYHAQTIPVLMRCRGVLLDADDAYPATNLEALDNAATDAALLRVRWYFNGEGHIVRTRPTGVSGAPVWATTAAAKALRKVLGFTGLEAEVTAGGLEVLTASEPAGIAPSRPFERVIDSTAWTGDAVQLTDQSAAINTVLNLRGYEVAMLLDGPGDCRDQARDYVTRFLPTMPPGTPCNVYQQLGDGRRTLRDIEVDAAQPAYGLLYTSERDGERGRLLVRRAVGSGSTQANRYPSRTRRRLPVILTFTEKEGGQ